ncbi:response regulator [Roseobacter sp. A03A-229]
MKEIVAGALCCKLATSCSSSVRIKPRQRHALATVSHCPSNPHKSRKILFFSSSFVYAMSAVLPVIRVQKRLPMRVLLIEDNDLDAFVTERALRSVVHDIEIARSVCAETALESARCTDLAFDFVLLDQNLSGTKGTDLVVPLRREVSTAKCPVIMLTGDHSDDTRIQALKHGATAFLSKPIDSRRFTDLFIERKLYWDIHDLPRNLERYKAAVAV